MVAPFDGSSPFRRECCGTFDAPTFVDARPNQTAVSAGDLADFRDGSLCALEDVSVGIPFVVGLFLVCGPPDVAFAVVALRIFSVDGMIWCRLAADLD